MRSDAVKQRSGVALARDDHFASPPRADAFALCQAVPLRGSKTMTGVSVDRRPA
jgi:hypothetical protein